MSMDAQAKHISEEAHEFKIHPAIIYSLITAQASGVEKALLELVMNSVDAGATRIDVRLDQEGFEVADNGRGFESMESIESCFGVIGLPHAENDAYYGRFRLGRLQSFGYAKTEWHSKNFKMFVDLNVELDAETYGYETIVVDEFYPGCVVKGVFYENMKHCNPEVMINPDQVGSPYAEDSAVVALALSVKYLPADVYINGIRANRRADEVVPYDVHKDLRFYLTPKVLNKKKTVEDHVNGFRKEVHIYNKGVYAYSLASEYFIGDVVANTALDLNMARNEAKSSCSVGRSIRNRLRHLEDEYFFKHLQEDAIEIKENPQQQYFVEQFWQKLFGTNGAKFDDFDEFMGVLKQPWFATPSDLRIGYLDLAIVYSSYANLSERERDRFTPNNLCFYSSKMFVAEGMTYVHMELLSHIGGFIPYEMLPGEDVIEHLKGTTLSFDMKRFPELHEFMECMGEGETLVTQEIGKNLTKNEVCQAICCFLSKIGVWLRVANDFDKINSQVTKKPVAAFTAIRNKFSSYGIGSDDFEAMGIDVEYMSIYSPTVEILGSLKLFASRAMPKYIENLERFGAFNNSPKELGIEFCENIKIRRNFEYSLILSPFEREVLERLKTVAIYMQYDLDRAWFKARNGINMNDSMLFDKRQLFLAELELSVLGCTDSFEYILLNEIHFRRLIAENKFDQLVYLIMHELAHCAEARSNVHGEVFYQGFQMLFETFPRRVGDFEFDVAEMVLRKSNFKSLDNFKKFGASKENVEYFLKQHMTRYEGRF